MRKFCLLRVANIESGIFGVLMDSGVPFCVTVENNDYVFPVGSYLCKRVNSPKFGNTFEVMDVPNRSNILFHWGNLESDSHGCILIAKEFGELYDSTAILGSKRCFAEFLVRTANVNDFELVVDEYLEDFDKEVLEVHREDLIKSDTLPLEKPKDSSTSLLGSRKGFRVSEKV